MWKNEMSEPEFSRTNTLAFGRPKCERIEVETDGLNLQHSAVLNAFAARILYGTPLVAEGVEGINGLTISNAMHLSAWTGKTIDIATFDHELFYEELSKRIATSRRKENVVESVAIDMSKTYGS